MCLFHQMVFELITESINRCVRRHWIFRQIIRRCGRKRLQIQIYYNFYVTGHFFKITSTSLYTPMTINYNLTRIYQLGKSTYIDLSLLIYLMFFCQIDDWPMEILSGNNKTCICTKFQVIVFNGVFKCLSSMFLYFIEFWTFVG